MVFSTNEPWQVSFEARSVPDAAAVDTAENKNDKEVTAPRTEKPENGREKSRNGPGDARWEEATAPRTEQSGKGSEKPRNGPGDARWEEATTPRTEQSGKGSDKLLSGTADERWYEATPLSGSAGEGIEVAITVSPNESYEARGVVVVLKSKSLEKRIELTQAKRNVILVGDNRREISSEEQTLSVEVQSNVQYTVTIKAGDKWIAELSETLSAPGLEERTHRFKISSNPNTQERTGIVVFTDKDSDLSDELTLVQAALIDPDPERTALRALYEHGGGGGWTHSDNWCSEKPLGEWYGVETDAEGRVIALRLPNNNLSGAILEHVDKLTSLRHLDLSHNALEEPLEILFNEGSPDGYWYSPLTNLLELETMDLNHNRLTGGPSTTWSRFEKLRYVDLSSNRLTDGPIPYQWAAKYENGQYIDDYGM